MNTKENSQAQTVNEHSEVMTFQFSESKQPIAWVEIKKQVSFLKAVYML